jgi:hypothetical protein
MHELSSEGLNIVDDLARHHGVGGDAVAALLRALELGPNSGSRKARARSDGRDFPAAHSPPTPSAFGFMHSPKILAIFSARWRRRNP